MELIAPTHVLTPSKPPVHIHLLSTYIYAQFQSDENLLSLAFGETRIHILQTDAHRNYYILNYKNYKTRYYFINTFF